MQRWRGRGLTAARRLGLALTVVLAGCSAAPGSAPARRGCADYSRPSAAAVAGTTPLDQWLARRPLFVAHRGGDADWVEGTAAAYRSAAAWNPTLALEVPVWRTVDGVWVVSEDFRTGRVFGTDLSIPASTWAQLSVLRSAVGGQPMARLVPDVLVPYGSSRILFIDNKSDQHVGSFFGMLERYSGPSHDIVKAYYASRNTVTEAHRRGYRTWGYYYDRNMGDFAATQMRFDLLGVNVGAPQADFAVMRATGKPVLTAVIAKPAQASSSACAGAGGYMVSGVTQVVPRG